MLFLAPIGHGLFVEVICYYFPDINNFWHAQSMIMLIGRRLPLHILFLCEYSPTLPPHLWIILSHLAFRHGLLLSRFLGRFQAQVQVSMEATYYCGSPGSPDGRAL